MDVQKRSRDQRRYRNVGLAVVWAVLLGALAVGFHGPGKRVFGALIVWVAETAIGLVLCSVGYYYGARFFRVQPGFAECLVGAVGSVIWGAVVGGVMGLLVLIGIPYVAPVAGIALFIPYVIWLRGTLRLKSGFDAFLLAVLPGVLFLVFLTMWSEYL